MQPSIFSVLPQQLGLKLDSRRGPGDAWVLAEGRITAQGPTKQVLQHRATLEHAHLKVPAVVEIALAIYERRPELAGRPLPASRDELIHLLSDAV